MAEAQIRTRLTDRFGLSTPLVLAPMALASGGRLAAAWASAGALGLLGGGYADLSWTTREYTAALNDLRSDAGALGRLGCGFITWKLGQDPSALDWLLDQPKLPSALMLSFGDELKWARRLSDRSIPLIVQIQRVEQLGRAIDAGATAVVAQGSEAGGHGMVSSLGRSTFTLVPEVADVLAKRAPNILLLGAGGVSDGRGLAALLMLGADGALIGTRAWATTESAASPEAKAAALNATGDETIRSSIFDILRRKTWPDPFNFRALRNDFHRQWEGRENELAASPDAAIAAYEEAISQKNFSIAHIGVGEGIGAVNDVLKTAALISKINTEASLNLGRLSRTTR